MTPRPDAAERALLAILAPLADYYGDPANEEIAINRPEEIWCRRRQPENGTLWLRVFDPRLSRRYLLEVLHAVANYFGKSFHPRHPDRPCTLYAALPGHQDRLTAIAGPAVQFDRAQPDGGIALCIRQGTNARNRVTSRAAWGVSDGEGVADIDDHPIVITDPRHNAIAAIRDAMAAHCGILIAGPTGCGKTQFMNSLIDDISPNTRILTVEDTRELQLPRHPNHIHLLISRTETAANFRYQDAIDIATRFTPDLCLFGEISMTNAAGLWALTQTGHGSSIVTIHASSPVEAYRTLTDRIAASSSFAIDRSDTLADVQERFAVIQLARDTATGERRLIAVVPPKPPRHARQGDLLALT